MRSLSLYKNNFNALLFMAYIYYYTLRCDEYHNGHKFKKGNKYFPLRGVV